MSQKLQEMIKVIINVIIITNNKLLTILYYKTIELAAETLSQATVMVSLFLVLVLLSVTSTETKGSYCMSTDFTNTGSYHHGGLSLYLRVCCNSSNLGQSVTIREPGINRYILCPKVLPKSCPKEVQKSCTSVAPSNSNQGTYTIDLKVHTQKVVIAHCRW